MKHIFNEVHYELTRKIAEGGMGLVYEATQKGIGGFRKVVAIKLIREEYIVSMAIDVMYATKAETYKKVKTPQNNQKGSTVNKPFREGLTKLAERLQVRVHEREAVTLEACQLVVAKLAQSSKSSQNAVLSFKIEGTTVS